MHTSTINRALARSCSSLMGLHSCNNTLMVQLFLLLFAALLLRWWIWRPRSRRPSPAWPPGPPSWPIVGHLHILLCKLPHQALATLSSTYGPLMGLRLGSVRAVVASSPQMAKEILQTHDLTFCHRPRIAAAVHMFFNCGDIAGSPNNGPVWKLMRQLCVTELFTAKRLASFRHVREEEVRGMVRAVVEKGVEGKRAVELRREVTAATNNIVSRMAMGKRVGELRMGTGRQQDVVQSLVKELMHLLGVFYVGDLIPWLWWLDPCGYLKQMKATGRKARAVAQAVIEERRQERRGRGGCGRDGEEDLLDVLLNVADASSPGACVITDKTTSWA